MRAIRAVVSQQAYLSAPAAGAVVSAFVGKTNRTADGALSARQRQILQLIAEGRSTKEIAETLRISVKTPDFHRSRILKKLDIHNTAGLVRYAIRQGLVQA